MMTHHTATVRDGQIVVRGLDVPDGTRVSITVIETGSEGWPANGQDPSLISLDEANAQLAPFRMKVVAGTAKHKAKASRGRGRVLPELIVPPDIAASLDQAFRDMKRGKSVSWAESSAEIAQLRADWIRRDQLRVRGPAGPDSDARPKQRGAVVAGQSRSGGAKSTGTRARGRGRSSPSKP
jgi:hypothetical protein